MYLLRIRFRICGRLSEVPIGRYTEYQQKYSVNKGSTIELSFVANYGQTDACLDDYWTATIGKKRNSPPVVAVDHLVHGVGKVIEICTGAALSAFRPSCFELFGLGHVSCAADRTISPGLFVWLAPPAKKVLPRAPSKNCSPTIMHPLSMNCSNNSVVLHFDQKLPRKKNTEVYR